MTIKYSGASDVEIVLVNDWLNDIIARSVRSDCPLPDKSKVRLITLLSTVTINIKNCRRNDKPVTVKRGTPRKIIVCRDHLSKTTVFSALVKLIGGMELDVEALENHCYKPEADFEDDDWKKIIKGSKDIEGERLRRGRFVLWDPCTGEKWMNEGSARSPKKGKSLRSNPAMPPRVQRKFQLLREDK